MFFKRKLDEFINWLVPNSWEANGLTRLRILLAALVTFLVPMSLSRVIPNFWLKVAFGFFIFGVFTDIADGSIARVRGEETSWGRFWDPIADKLLAIGPIILAFLKYLQNQLLLSLLISFLAIELAVIIVNWQIFQREREQAQPNIFGKAVTAWLGLVCGPILFFGFLQLLAVVLAIGLIIKILSLNDYLRHLLKPLPR